MFTLAVLSVLWILPSIEQVTNPPGNLYKIAYHFASSEAPAGHGLSESLTAVSAAVNAPLAKLAKGLSPGVALPTGHWAFMLIHLGLLGTALVINFKTGRKYLAYLLLLGFGCLMVSVVSVTRITGEIFPYLIKWMSFIGLVNWLAIGFTGGAVSWRWLEKRWGGSLAKRWNNQWVKAVPSALVILMAVSFLAITRAPVAASANVQRDQPEARMVAKITEGIKAYIRNARLPHVTLALRRDLWPIEAGVVNQLYKSSISFSLEEDWLFWFGYQFRIDPGKSEREEKRGQVRNRDDVLVFKLGGTPGKVSNNNTLVYRLGQISIFHIQREVEKQDER